MFILRKVLNSLMTCCVSYFVATLTPYMSYMWFIRFHRPSSFSGPPVVSLDLTWPAFCRMSWQRFVLIRSPISPSSVQIESRLLVFCCGWRKANRKIQGKTLGASDTFNIQEKCFKKNIIDLVLVKAFRWPIRDKTRSDHVTRNVLATQSFAIVKTNSSLLRTVCFVPGERQPLHFL